MIATAHWQAWLSARHLRAQQLWPGTALSAVVVPEIVMSHGELIDGWRGKPFTVVHVQMDKQPQISN